MSFPEDCLPPENDYKSCEDLVEAINAWAKPRGYVLTTARSWLTDNGRRMVLYGCNRRSCPPKDLENSSAAQ